MQRISRVAAALFLLVGAGIHLDLWRTGYRGIRWIGPLFVANVAVSAVLIVALLVSADVRVAASAVAFALGSMVALVLSRTTGLLGFTERAWTDMAVQATTAELGAVVAIAFALVAMRRSAPAPATVPVRSRRSR
jgi:O-antigen/teichoic acid export membrane protein